MVSRLGVAYFAGAVAAFISSISLWGAGQLELLAWLGVISPKLTLDWLQGRVLGGSLWALAFPLVRRRGYSPVRAGLMLSLFVTVAELVIFLPLHNHRFLGLGLGAFTPLVVLITNAIWGWALARVMVSTGHS